MEKEIVIQHIANSSLAGQQQRFAKDRVTLGRDPQADVAFDPDEDLFVSYRHAEIYREGDRLFIQDTGSRNGTYVNQRRIDSPQLIGPDDAVHLGATGPQIRVSLVSPDELESGGGLRATLGQLFSKKTMAGRGGTQRPEPIPPTVSSEPGSAGAPEMPGKSSAAGAPQGRPVAAEPVPQAPPLPQPTYAPAQPTRSSPVLRILGLGLLVVVAGVVGAAGYGLALRFLRSEPEESNPASEALEPEIKWVVALGRIEPRGGILDIGGPTGVTIQEVKVTDGQLVAREDELVRLSTYDVLKAEYDAAKSALEFAMAQDEATEKYAAATEDEAREAVVATEQPLDLELQAAEAEVALVQAHYDAAVSDREELEDLGERADASQLKRAELAERRAERDLLVAQKRVEQLRASIESRRSQAQLGLRTALTNAERLRNSVDVATAQRNVDRAQIQMEQAIIRAPRSGRVLKIFARDGAVLNGRPILQMGDTDDMVVMAEVYESDVRNVKSGQRATISGDALPEQLNGSVEQVLWTVNNNQLRDVDPTAPEDLRVVSVRVRIDDDEVAKHRALLEHLINHQVRVRIELGD